jgi:hypothetical protein
LLLAFAISDYYPLGGGQNWSYSGTADGFTSTATMIADAGISEGGVTTTRLQLQFHDVNGTFTDSRYWNQSAAGLKLLREDHWQSPQIDRYPNGGLLMAPPTMNAGQTVPLSTPLTSSLNGANVQQNLQGTVVFSGEESVVTPAGVFNAIKLTLNVASTVVGSTAHGTHTETQWLVRGIGMVKVQLTETDYYAGGSQSTDTILLSLTGSSLLRPILSLSGNGRAIVSGDSTPTTADGSNFGGIDAEFSTRDRTFTITNTGTQALNLIGGGNSLSISGPGAGRFSLIALPGSTVAPGASTQFTLRFNPAGQTGIAVANIAIASNDVAAPSYSFVIQGNGLALPRAQITGHQIVIANGDPQATTADWSKFAGIDAKFGTKTRVFAIHNIGLAPLNLSGPTPVTLTGPNADRYSVIVQPTSPIAPGASVQFFIRFVPNGRVGFADATVRIASNDPIAAAYTFAIQGNGLALPRAEVSNSGVVINTGSHTPNLTDKTDFSTVAADGVGNAVRVRLFTITNIGLANLALTGTPFITIIGPDASDFIISAQPALGSLAPGQSITFKVRFDPASEGTKSATVVMNTNENPVLSPSTGQFTFDIAGIGGPAA